jgi:hypothetical protein
VHAAATGAGRGGRRRSAPREGQGGGAKQRAGWG